MVFKLDGAITDVFGTPNSDPSNNWSGNGVSTENSNIALLSSINSEELTGFTDPSTRFETINTSPSDIVKGGLDGFGVSPLTPTVGFDATTITKMKAMLPLTLGFL